MLHVIFRRSRRAGIIVLLLAVVLVVLGAILATTARAQAGPSRQFVYLRSTDTLGTEVVTERPSSIMGVLTMRGAPVIRWEQQHADRAPGRVTVSIFAPGVPTTGLPTQNVVVNMAGDSAKLTISANGTTSEQAVLSAAGAVALVGNSVLHTALMADYARGTNKAMLPVFLTAGGRTVTATVRQQGDTTVFSIAGMDARIMWDSNGGPREITIPAQNLRVVRTTATIGTASAPAAVDYGAPTSAPYTAEDVVIPTRRGYSLAATLTRPRGAAKAPVVITISGSGPQERDSRIATLPGYALFREIADTLGRRGIAVLRWDDRGVGASGGLESARRGTSADVADDVRTIVAWLRARGDIDGTRIALAGHSEGGMVAPMVGVSDPSLRAVALLAGPAYTGKRVSMQQNREVLAGNASLTPAQRDSILRTLPAQLDSAGRANPWIGFWLAHDPLPVARKLRQPVLILQGNTDTQVSPEQADTLGAAIRAGGNTRVTVRRFPATNHLFLADSSGAFANYAALKDKTVRREVLGAMADWVVRVMK